jgi:hypothetical protein
MAAVDVSGRGEIRGFKSNGENFEVGQPSQDRGGQGHLRTEGVSAARGMEPDPGQSHRKNPSGSAGATVGHNHRSQA